MLLVSYALAAPWLYPTATSVPQGNLNIPLEVGGGAALFIRPGTEHPNPYADFGADYDPGIFVQATTRPLPWLQINATLGAGMAGNLQPIIGIRGNFIDSDAIHLGAFFAATAQGSLSPSIRSLIVTHGLVLDTGTKHFRFDLALPLLGKEYVNPNQGGSGLTDMADAWGVVTPGAIYYQECGFSGLFGPHTLRAGLLYTMINLSYRYNAETWYIGGGAAADIPLIANRCFSCQNLPVIGKIEGGYRF